MKRGAFRRKRLRCNVLRHARDRGHQKRECCGRKIKSLKEPSKFLRLLLKGGSDQIAAVSRHILPSLSNRDHGQHKPAAGAIALPPSGANLALHVNGTPRLASDRRYPIAAWALRTSLSPAEGKLMNAVIVRRSVMKYRGQEFQYDTEVAAFESNDQNHDSSGDKQYRRKRSIKATRRRSKNASHPGCGIGARRNNRWTW
jgi:hypothetical protein